MAIDETILLSAVIFGLSGGLSPGPLLTLVISETMKYGAVAGIKIAIAPLITDIPILLAAVLTLSQVDHIAPVLGAIALAGSAFLIYLAWESLRFAGLTDLPEQNSTGQVGRGVAANFLNPSPYLFWFSIGAPTVLKSTTAGSHLTAALFLAVFFSLLVGAKVMVALIVGRSRHFLRGRPFILTIRGLGLLLLAFALLFLRDGLRYFVS